MTELFSDDFNDGVIDPAKWTYTGNAVTEEDGLLKLQQNVTDQDVHLRSTSLDVPSDGKVHLDRRFMVHRSNNFYYGTTCHYLNGDNNSYVNLQYLYTAYYDDGHYDYSNPRAGIFVTSKLGEAVSTIRICDIVFDTWHTEHVRLDFVAGTLTYSIDTSTYSVSIPGLASQPVDSFCVQYYPSGWWTGHQHYMDYVSIYGSETQHIVTTSPVSSITSTGATCGGNIPANNCILFTDRGVCWSTSQNPTVADAHTGDGTGAGAFTSTLTGLTPSTTYYVRAYSINSMDTTYGNEVSFTTESDTPSGDGQPCPGTPTVTDHEGNVYNTVLIGSQCWMRENLRTTTSPSTGTYLIPADGNTYTYTGKLARWYNNDSTTYAPMNYGLLYNWNAATDTFNTTYEETSLNTNYAEALSVSFTEYRRGICPAGWHLPSDAEWNTMEETVSGSDWQPSYATTLEARGSHAGKLAGGADWHSTSNFNAPGNMDYADRNASGFSVIPAGFRHNLYFGDAGRSAMFWTSTQRDGDAAYYRVLYYENATVLRYYDSKCNGFSVRCILDDTVTATLPTVTTDTVSDITTTTATSGGNVTADGGATVTARGVCWNATGTPTVSDNHTTDGTGTGVFTSTLTGLMPNTTYYVRAYATNSEGTAYGNEVTFTTECPPVSVILGDSIICNVGELLFAYVMPAVDPNAQLSYTWYKDNMVVASGSTDHFLASETGSYWVVVSDNGCTSESSDVYVILPNAPQLQLIASGNNICEDGSTVITAQTTSWHLDDILYSWSVGNHEGTSYTFVPDHAGAFTFTVTATDAYTGCESDASITINVFGQPDISISGNTDINYGQAPRSRHQEQAPTCGARTPPRQASLKVRPPRQLTP